jgi:hypothetical protein
MRNSKRKVVRLTESDLSRLVRKIIKEGDETSRILDKTITDIGRGDVSGYYSSGDFVGDVISSLPKEVGEEVKNSGELKKRITDYFWKSNPSDDTYD